MRINNISKLKIILTICAILVLSTSNQISILGHDPSLVILEYHYEDQILEVYIQHLISYPDRHWVNNVQIRRNNVLVGNYSYNSQPTTTDFIYNYSISAVHFDILKVSVFCNYFGETVEEIMVLDPDNPNTRPPTEEVGLAVTNWIIITSVILLITSRWLKKKNDYFTSD